MKERARHGARTGAMRRSKRREMWSPAAAESSCSQGIAPIFAVALGAIASIVRRHGRARLPQDAGPRQRLRRARSTERQAVAERGSAPPGRRPAPRRRLRSDPLARAVAAGRRVHAGLQRRRLRGRRLRQRHALRRPPDHGGAGRQPGHGRDRRRRAHRHRRASRVTRPTWAGRALAGTRSRWPNQWIHWRWIWRSGRSANRSRVNLGNPHAVFFVDDAAAVPLAELGPSLERHELFPERANIGVAEVRDRHTIRLRVWERGAGLTTACGSGACAALVAAVRRGLAERSADLLLDGGTLRIAWNEADRVLMTGPAKHSFKGRLDPEMLAVGTS